MRISRFAFFAFLLLWVFAGCKRNAVDLKVDARTETDGAVISQERVETTVVTGEPLTPASEEEENDPSLTADDKPGAVAVKAEY